MKKFVDHLEEEQLLQLEVVTPAAVEAEEEEEEAAAAGPETVVCTYEVFSSSTQSLADPAINDSIVVIGRKLLQANLLALPNIKHSKLASKISSDSPVSTATTSWLFTEQMVQHIFSRVQDLQKEDVTKSMKMKAVIDLFKHLKSLGFTSYYRNTRSLMGDDTTIFDMTSIKYEASMFVEEAIVDSVRGDVQYAEKCYYAVLDAICVLRFNAQYNEDLTKDNVKRGAGFLVEYFYYLRRLYNHIGGVFNASNGFLRFAEAITISQPG